LQLKAELLDTTRHKRTDTADSKPLQCMNDARKAVKSTVSLNVGLCTNALMRDCHPGVARSCAEETISHFKLTCNRQTDRRV